MTDRPDTLKVDWQESVTVAQLAEAAGIEAIIPVARWKGMGGKVNFNHRNFETFTWAAGLAANLTFNPLDTVTTVTVQIVTLLTGDQEFNSAKTLSAFGLGLTLFLVTLMLNIIAHRIVQTYREQYD